MVINGRCRGNGAQLAYYCLNLGDNDRAEFLAMYGAASSDPRRALLEMSLTSAITGRTSHGLYHMQLSPRIEEAAEMTWEQKMRAVEITAEQMGLAGHRWWLAEHEKDGRMHLHLAFERYNHDTNTMWKDLDNYAKHMAASRQMEKEFGWQLTHENKNHLDQGIKAHILGFYLESENGADFIKTMNKAGFEVTQGMDRRPYQIVDQYGTVHDLSRQLKGIGQGDVSKYLNDVRAELRPTAEASHDRRSQYERNQPELEQSEVLRELSDSQDLAKAMIKHVRQNKAQKPEVEQEPPKTYSYSFKVEQPPALPRQPVEQMQSDKSRELSDSQDLAVGMLMHQRQQQINRERKVQEAQKQAREQGQPANDNQQAQRYYNPITGQEMTPEAYQKLQDFIKRQNEREQERKTRGRGGLEY